MKENLNRAESSERFNAQILLDKIMVCDFDAVLQLVMNTVKTINNKELKLSLILFCYDFKRLEKQVNKGIIKKEDEFLEERKIVNRLLEQILSYNEY